MKSTHIYLPTLAAVSTAATRLKEVVKVTPLEHNSRYSQQYQANVYLKREDLQVVRSYKIRGAYNRISSQPDHITASGVICASAGNHAQGVALSCKLLQIPGTIYMPVPTPAQKVAQVKLLGESYVDIQLIGDTFDDAYQAALEASNDSGALFVHPFDDTLVIEGQGTVGLEIWEQSKEPIDWVFLPIGGGGLASGLSTVFKAVSPQTKIVGVEPEGAPAMKTSIKQKENTTLERIDKFVDGAAVKRVGDITFGICHELLSEVVTVAEGKVCETVLDLYNKDGIIVEPAGALAISALDQFQEQIKGQNVVCVVSGGNNDITRTAEIKERAMLHANLKHYFIVKFPQRAGALREFVVDILGPNDDITHFEYTKKTNRENGAAVVGIELKDAEDWEPLVTKMKENNFYGDYLNDKPDLFQFLI